MGTIIGIGNGIGVRKSAQLKRIPFYTDALYELGDTISGNAFIDKISGKSFPITGYDFPTGWTKGFPYKSAATVSAPADYAALVAADINNFWYTTGIPNQIPVVSLFQDIDYEHKFFNFHTAQTVDSNGVEIYEPRVSKMVGYNRVMAGADLVTCQFAYLVPVEVTTNALWISGSGLVGNAGTKASPYRNLMQTSYTNGKTIYIKSGTYSENHSAAANGYWLINGDGSYKGIGNVKVSSQSSAGQVAAVASAKVANFEGLWFNDTVRKAGISFLGTARPVVINKCMTSNTNTPLTGTLTSLTIANSTLDGNTGMSFGAMDISITDCKISVAMQNSLGISGICNIFNSKLVNHTILTSVNNSNCNVIDNSFSNGTFNNIPTNTGVFTFRYNKCNSVGMVIQNGKGLLYDITNNTYTSTTSTQIFIEGNNAKINSNILVSTTDNMAKISFNTLTGLGTVEIKNNRIISHHLSEPSIIVGNESDLNYNSISGVISGNKLAGIKDFIPLSNPTSHALVVFNNSQISIKRNYVSGGGLGIVYKNLGLDSAGQDISYNIVKNCGNGLINKGHKNLKVFGNLVYNCTGNSVNFVDNGVIHTDGCIFKNNIIFDNLPSNPAYISLASIGSTNHISDNNVIYSVNNKSNFNTGAANLTLAQWKALGFDLNSIITDPLLDANLIPVTPILIGENLGANYEDGLDVSTNWGNDSVVPVIVTKKQPTVGNWQVGAYIQL